MVTYNDANDESSSESSSVFIGLVGKTRLGTRSEVEVLKLFNQECVALALEVGHHGEEVDADACHAGAEVSAALVESLLRCQAHFSLFYLILLL